MAEMTDRFWANVNKRGHGECWPWTGKARARAYGQMWCSNRRRMVFAHRVSYELHNGKIPDGAVIRHSCDNPICVNPAHLLAGTQRDNIMDRVRGGRTVVPGLKGEDCGAARLSEAEVLKIRSLYSRGNVSQRALGEIFGVGATTVFHIVHRNTWKELSR